MTSTVNVSVSKIFRVVVREPIKADKGTKVDYFVLHPLVYYPNYKFALMNTGGAVTK